MQFLLSGSFAEKKTDQDVTLVCLFKGMLLAGLFTALQFFVG